MDKSTASDREHDSLPIEYKRSIAVVRVSLWFLIIIFGLILGSSALGLQILDTKNTTPVLIITLVTLFGKYKLNTEQASHKAQRYMHLGLILPILGIPVAYHNGYLPLTFAPILMILSQCFYRGRSSKLIPYVIWFSWSAAFFLSPVKEGQPFGLRLLLITLVLIPITDVLLRQSNWERETKEKLLSRVLAMGVLVVTVLGIHQFSIEESVAPALVSMVIFGASYATVSTGKLSNLKYRLAISVALFGAFWFDVAQNGVLPVSVVAGFILFSFLLLPALEGLFFSLGLTTLSLLPLLTLEPTSLDFAPAPFFLRHFAVTLMLIFVFYQLFRVRETEVGYQPGPTPVAKGMLIATTFVAALALIESVTTVDIATSTLDARTGPALINGLLIWLFVTWLSAVYLRNQGSLKQTVNELAKSKEALQQKLQQQRHLFAVISHELRTPAAALSMLLHQHKDEKSAPNEQLKMVELSDHLVEVLNDLRQVTQPDQVKVVELKPTNLYELIERTTGPLSHLLSERQQRITLNTFDAMPQMLLLDRQHVRQVVTNLVKNASVHSGCTQIDVDVYSDQQEETVDVRIIISDNGRGLDPSMQNRLFEAFTRGNTDADGTGLGLYICQQLAQQMGGGLSYQPREGGGSCFTLEFSARLPDEEELKLLSPKAIQDNVKGKRVLLAEDNKTIQMITAKILEKVGATLTLADNGKIALERYQSTPDAFDIILTDIMMPQMDGYQLTRELRALGCTLPIIGITAATIGEEREQLLEQGATQVIAKPITVDALQLALQP